MTAFFRFILCTWFIACTFIKEHVCVKNVAIRAEKFQVDFQSNVTLYCDFELETDEHLLSVSWSRGNHEFFSYRPSYKQPMKTSTAYNIKVDMSKSNKTYVTLTDVGYELDGNVSCEVAPDTRSGKPSKLRSHTVTLQVISPPQENPIITTSKKKYAVNDTLDANCTSSLSYPPSTLTFLLGNEPVGAPSPYKIRCNESRPGYPMVPCRTHDNRTTWTWLPLSLRLEEKNFIGNTNKIKLTCIAIVENTNYRITSEITIPSGSNEPKTQQMQSSATAQHHFLQHQILTIIMGTIVWLSSK